ncbi:MAG: hypothetical protein Q7T36_10955 [Fluviicoccus sp.]|uniref:hypothetical protein n=1 Tax=Fluviicoccus sp. TaxID=2003552 RepID=UPI002726253F|nr:hypothetical protein [Fluviicoccus sp.]MDO8330975.1 hypothetical protein [Fluviicoccus sp.]
MDFLIKSFVGAGPIQFGMSQQEVRQLTLGPVRAFRRTPTQALPSDHFTDLGIVVAYKPPGVVEAIEFSAPSNPIFNGVSFFGQDVARVREVLVGVDPSLEVDGDGFISHCLGVGVYAVEADEEDEEPPKIVSVIVFENGYYD